LGGNLCTQGDRHNRFVVEELQQKGAIFVDSVDEVPEANA